MYGQHLRNVLFFRYSSPVLLHDVITSQVIICNEYSRAFWLVKAISITRIVKKK